MMQILATKAAALSVLVGWPIVIACTSVAGSTPDREPSKLAESSRVVDSMLSTQTTRTLLGPGDYWVPAVEQVKAIRESTVAALRGHCLQSAEGALAKFSTYQCAHAGVILDRERYVRSYCSCHFDPQWDGLPVAGHGGGACFIEAITTAGGAAVYARANDDGSKEVCDAYLDPSRTAIVRLVSPEPVELPGAGTRPPTTTGD